MGILILSMKRLWNTIIIDGSIPQDEIEHKMNNSYMLMISEMTKKDKQSMVDQR